MGLKLLNDGTIGRKTPREDGRLTNESLSSGYFLQVALANGGDEGGAFEWDLVPAEALLRWFSLSFLSITLL